MEDSDFCEFCRAIDFEGISKLKICHGVGVIIEKFDALYNQLKTSNCPLCRLFGIVAPDNLAYRFQLRAFSAKNTLAGANTGELVNVLDSVLLGVISRSHGSSVPEHNFDGSKDLSEYQKMRQSLQSTGFIALNRTPLSLGATRPNFRYNPIDTRLDISWAKMYIDYCDKNHQVGCATQELSAVHNLRVIDCNTRAVVSAPPSCKYLALSYVWGEPDGSDSHHTFQQSHLGAVPKTIRDSIEVTLALGYEYLWVDQYCINQKDRADKHDQVRQMDKIYSGAQVTIVAAAGTDASYGLPGASGTLRKPQTIVQTRGFQLFATGPHPKHLVRKSKWAKRGWTYQEGVLSKRRLIFTDQKIFYDCNGMHGAECLDLPLDEMHGTNSTVGQKSGAAPKEFGAGIPTGPLGYKTPVKEKDMWNILVCIDDFKQRALTFEDDRLEALQGIFKVFESKSSPVKNFMGVPIMFPPEPAAYPPQSPLYSPLGSLIDGLTWQHLGPTYRSSKFPSWSWAGWTGAICHRPLQITGFLGDGYSTDEYNPLIWVETPARTLIPISDSWADLHDTISLYSMTTRYLHIEADTFPCDIVLATKSRPTAAQLARWHKSSDARPGWHVRIPIILHNLDAASSSFMQTEYFYAPFTPNVLPQSSDIYVPVAIDMEFGCQAPLLLGIVLKGFWSRGFPIYAMIVKEFPDLDCWERVGLVELNSRRVLDEFRMGVNTVQRRIRIG